MSVSGEGTAKVELWWFTRLGAGLVVVAGMTSHADALVLTGTALRLVSIITFVRLARQIADAQATAIELHSVTAARKPELLQG